MPKRKPIAKNDEMAVGLPPSLLQVQTRVTITRTRLLGGTNA